MVHLSHLPSKHQENNTMGLPSNGSVVLIDDKSSQATPIIKALSKKGISTTWYQGIDQDELPVTPIQNIRLAFIDLQLIEGDNNGHTIATRLVNILKKIIGKENGPYMLILWSLKDSLYGAELRNEIKKDLHSIVPSCIISIDKTACISRKINSDSDDIIDAVLKELKPSFDEQDLESIKSSIENNWIINEDAEYEVRPDAIHTIESAIEKELKVAGVFHLFVLWENLVKKAANRTVCDISNTIVMDKYWESNMRDVFKRMGVARVGQNKVEENVLLRESVLTFMQSFSDNLESELKNEKFPDYISLKSDQLISMDIDLINFKLVKSDSNIAIYKQGKLFCEAGDIFKLKAKVEKSETLKLAKPLLDKYLSIPQSLNSSLHLESNPSQELIPGNIYTIEVSNEEKKLYLKTYLKKCDELELDRIQFIELEVSPICDYAQKKWKKSRLISGVIYPSYLEVNTKDHLYGVEPIFYLEREGRKIIFDCHLFKSLDHVIVKKREVKYRLRRELLLDIIAKVSSHVNRPGISFVN